MATVTVPVATWTHLSVTVMYCSTTTVPVTAEVAAEVRDTPTTRLLVPSLTRATLFRMPAPGVTASGTSTVSTYRSVIRPSLSH